MGMRAPHSRRGLLLSLMTAGTAVALMACPAEATTVQQQRRGLIFTCINPQHHDGDNIRCSNIEGRMRLAGIDAPEMPGACAPGRSCTPGDPFKSRDALRSLTAGTSPRCKITNIDRYGRGIVDCYITRNGQPVSLSCEMIRLNHAVPRYGTISCPHGQTR